MRRAIRLFVIFIMVIGVSVLSAEGKEERLDGLLLPYQNVIDKVNRDLGAPIYIPEKSKEKVYNNIKHLSPDELEALMRKEYLDTLVTNIPEKNGNSSESLSGNPRTEEEVEGAEPLPNAVGYLEAVPLH